MPAAETQSRQTTCCIVGGGPAGVMLAYLLARQNIDVTVVEKHKDFFRDFRGDTIHPSTLELIYELGLLDAFLALPHQEIDNLAISFGGKLLPMVDCSHLPTHCKFIALMPQWDFLNFMTWQAQKFPSFHLLMEHEVTGLIEENGNVVGVRADTPHGEVEIRAALTVGCDGRHSVSSASAHLHGIDQGAPIDVLWFRLSRNEGEVENVLGNFNYGTGLILINRGDYFQCGFIIAKDSLETQLKPAGLPALRDTIARLVPLLGTSGPDGKSRLEELTSWDQLKLLSVQVNHLERWHTPGLLCIGDAAHAMSPVGGIGINLAIQDAVAAASILTEPLQSDTASDDVLALVQHRREPPARITQSIQIAVHFFLARFLGKPGSINPPFILRLLSPHSFFRRTAARFIGLGIRPEHIRGPVDLPN